MKNRQRYLIFLAVVAVVVAVSLYLIFSTTPRLGLDLKGGTNIVLTAKETKGAKVTEEAIDQARLIVEERVNKLGVTEPIIERQVGTPNIIVQLPGIKNPDAAVKLIGKTALLEFKPVTGFKANGKPKLGPTVMTGSAIKQARVGFDQIGSPKVDIQFTAKGTAQFARVTGQLVGKQLAIILDNKVMSMPTVNEQITGGRAEITGKFSLRQVKNLVLVLNTGALPVRLDVTEKRTIGPTLGMDSLRAGLFAGIVGLIIVAIYMLISYRGLGLISLVGLAIFASIFGGILTLMKATLTLPGIAAIILTIGMAADSSIVFFERFKEEVQIGKTTWVAADQGFAYAFRAILDADAVTLIIAATLLVLSYLYFGAGPVRGFAFTLSLGTLTDIFTAFFFTHSALALLSKWSIYQNPFFIGVRKVKK